MQLYKARDFSALFQDTFAFVKRFGKHFFKHFFIVNGVFLLVLLVIGYFLMNFYSEMLFGSMGSPNQSSAMDQYVNENFGIFILLVILFMTVGLISAVIAYAYTPIYLKLYNQQGNNHFGTKEIVGFYKTNLDKIFIFLLCGILIGIPAVIAFALICLVLFITMIGALLIPVLIGAFALFFTMTLMEYLEGKKGIWDCFGYSWTLMSSKFWAAVGSVGIFYMMSYLIQNVITLIAYFFGILKMLTGFGDGSLSQQDVGGIFTVVMMISFFLGFILSAVLNTIVLLNQGIVFYSLKEEKEHINTKSVIDQIGSGE